MYRPSTIVYRLEEACTAYAPEYVFTICSRVDKKRVPPKGHSSNHALPR
jgi:hypothetical protein